MIKATKPADPTKPVLDEELVRISKMKTVQSIREEVDGRGQHHYVIVTAKDMLTHKDMEGYLPQVEIRFSYLGKEKLILLNGFSYVEAGVMHPILRTAIGVPGTWYHPCLGGHSDDIYGVYKSDGLYGMITMTIAALQQIHGDDDEWED